MNEFFEILFESVDLPIKVGDTVKMGRFKNKSVKVKSIDWNDKGDLLINNRPALKFRIIKKEVEEEFGAPAGVLPGPSRKAVKKNKTDKMSGYKQIKEFVNKPKMKKALQKLVDKNLIPKVYVKNTRKLQTFLTNNPMVMTQLLRILGEKVNEAFAVRGSKVEKFITGKNLTHKGRKYKEIEFETIKVDNPKKMVTLRILAPKNLFGQEVPVRFQTLRRGPFLKTDTGKKLKEQKEIKKVIAIYPGRFQPFGPHHKKVYLALKKKFGDVYIVTSNIQKPPRHPMNFKEKVQHMTKMGIPSNKIIMDNPYKPINLLKKFKPEETAAVFAVGQKDKGRLSSGYYFDDYNKNKNNLKGYKEHGYVLQAPHVSVSVAGKEVSGTTMRQILGSSKIKPEQRKKLFKQLFGYFNDSVYKMMIGNFKNV